MKSHAAWVIHAGAIGDFVLTLSLIQAMRRASYAPIRILGRPHYGNLAGAQDGVDSVADIEAAPWHRLFGPDPGDAIDAMFAAEPAALVLDLLGVSDASIQAMRSCGVDRVIQLDSRATPKSTEHITRQWHAEIERQGLYLPIEPPTIRIEADARQPRDRAVLHVGSGSHAKRWPLECWIDVAKLFQKRGLEVCFPLGPAELEPCEAAAWSSLDRVGRRIETPSFAELKALIGSSRIYVGNDSGITHLAAALGTPTLAIFGATDPCVWRPPGDNATVVGTKSGWPTLDAVSNAIAALMTASDRGNATDVQQM